MVLKQIVEALVFASQKPLTPREIVAALRSASGGPAEGEFARAKEAEIAALLEQIKIELIESGRGFQLVEQASGWQLMTDPHAAPWVRLLYPEARPTRLSGPALETLASLRTGNRSRRRTSRRCAASRWTESCNRCLSAISYGSRAARRSPDGLFSMKRRSISWSTSA